MLAEALPAIPLIAPQAGHLTAGRYLTQLFTTTRKRLPRRFIHRARDIFTAG